MNPLAAIDLGRAIAWGAVLVSVTSVIWMHGYSRGERKLFEYQAEQARAAVPVVVRQGKITERVVTRWRERTIVLEGETQFLEKEVVRYVPAASDPVLPRGWWLLHDAAATAHPVSDAARGADEATPGIAASVALKGVIRNYGTCHAIRAQLVALQDWVTEQQANDQIKTAP